MTKRSFQSVSETTLSDLPEELVISLLVLAANRAQFYVCKQWYQLMQYNAKICWWDTLLSSSERQQILLRVLPSLVYDSIVATPCTFQVLQLVFIDYTLYQDYLDKVALLYDGMRKQVEIQVLWTKRLSGGNLLDLVNGHQRDLYFNLFFTNGKYQWRHVRSCNFGGTLRPVRDFIRSLFSCDSHSWNANHHHWWTNSLKHPIDTWPLEYHAFAKQYCQQLSLYRTYWCIYSEELRLYTNIGILYEKLNSPERRFVLVGYNTSERYISLSAYDRKEARIHYVYNLPDCAFSYYSVELQLQKLLLEKYYGLIVDEMWLLHTKEVEPPVKSEIVRYEIEWNSDFMERAERIVLNTR